jgi:hypothetical protein
MRNGTSDRNPAAVRSQPSPKSAFGRCPRVKPEAVVDLLGVACGHAVDQDSRSIADCERLFGTGDFEPHVNYRILEERDGGSSRSTPWRNRWGTELPALRPGPRVGL